MGKAREKGGGREGGGTQKPALLRSSARLNLTMCVCVCVRLNAIIVKKHALLIKWLKSRISTRRSLFFSGSASQLARLSRSALYVRMSAACGLGV